MERPTELQKAWFAGFYEGEGTICSDKHNGNRLRLSISQNDITPLLLAQKFWGGHIYQRVRKSPASDKICTGHEWSISHNFVLKFIEDIYPYMIVPYKINQVKAAYDQAATPSEIVYNCKFCDKLMHQRQEEDVMRVKNI